MKVHMYGLLMAKILDIAQHSYAVACFFYSNTVIQLTFKTIHKQNTAKTIVTARLEGVIAGNKLGQ